MTLPSPPVLGERHALFLDFDGTLVPLQDNTSIVEFASGQAEVLLKLADQRDGALALISGRDVRDLAKRMPNSLLRIGNHGLYALRPGDTDVPDLDGMPEVLHKSLEATVRSQDGAQLDIKGPVGTVHFRACPEAGLRLIDAVKTATATQSGYRANVGTHFVEAVPDGANKGAALIRTMAELPFAGRIPVMVGDDMTDEDGFLAAQRLGGFGVKVGDGDTVARKWLMDVDAVWDWLGSAL